MTKTRLEAFSDGVLAIILTIMVLELKVPHSTSCADIVAILPTLISYVISFMIIGIYWGNHHHLIHTLSNVKSSIMWANLHLLFWLSLIPYATKWMGENITNSFVIAVYAALQCLCGIAYSILLSVILKESKNNKKVIASLESQTKKGKLSTALYVIAIPAAFLHPLIPFALFLFVSASWFIPDKNIEKAVNDNEKLSE